MYPIARKNQRHHPHFTEVEAEAQRSCPVAQPGVYVALDYCVICESPIGTIPRTLRSVVRSGT